MASGLLCARPGCSGGTVAWLTYDYAAGCVWLDDTPGPSGDQWGMCTEHAARLRAPRGWAMVDRRVAKRVPPGYPTTMVS